MGLPSLITLVFFTHIIVPRFLKNYIRPGKKKKEDIEKMIEKAEFCVFQKGKHYGVIIITII